MVCRTCRSAAEKASRGVRQVAIPAERRALEQAPAVRRFPWPHGEPEAGPWVAGMPVSRAGRDGVVGGVGGGGEHREPGRPEPRVTSPARRGGIGPPTRAAHTHVMVAFSPASPYPSDVYTGNEY